MSASDPRHVLVIKLGALGDFIHAFHAFAAIRAHHPEARIDLLTTAPFAELATASPWFDRVRIDPRAPWWNLSALRRTLRAIRGHDIVYDLQTSRRSSRYFALAGRPPWSGIAKGCAYPHDDPDRDRLHTLERQQQQLMVAGITRFPRPEYGWLTGRGQLHGMHPPLALLVPGSSAGPGCRKRWPVERYGEIAARLERRGIAPVVVGTRSESGLAQTIRAGCPAAVDLTGRTSLFDIASLAVQARLVVGNDTGPTHLAAAVGAPTLALFSARSSIAEAAPRGPDRGWALTLRELDLANLATGRVAAAALSILDGSPS